MPVIRSALLLALLVLGLAATGAHAAVGIVTVTKNGTGAGTVVSAPAGIDCGSACSGAFATPSDFQLTATPAAGSRFAGWSGPRCNGLTVNPCFFALLQSTAMTATFNLAATLTVVKDGTGEGTVTAAAAGINCGATCAAELDRGTVVTLTATSIAGSRFAGWSGGGCSGTGTCQVTLDESKSVTATFDKAALIELSYDPTGGGTGKVVLSPGGGECTSQQQLCSFGYSSGTTVTLTVVPDPGTAASFGPCDTSTATTCTVALKVYARVNLRLIRAQTVTTARAGAGAGTITLHPGGSDCSAGCSQVIPTGARVLFSADNICILTPCLTPEAASGSRFAGWSGLGCSALPTPQCDLLVTADTTITGTFVKQRRVSVAKTGSGSGTITGDVGGIACGDTCSAVVDNGTTVTLTASPAAGSRFAGWSGGGCSGTGACQVSGNAAEDVTATFIAQVDLTVSVFGSGSGTVTSTPPGIACGQTCSATFDKGTVVTLSATVDAGSVLGGAGFQGCQEPLDSPTCTFTLDRGRNVDVGFWRVHTLTVTKTGTGEGTVRSDIWGVDCGSICSALFVADAEVTLEAAPASGSTFAGWSGGGCSGTGGCTVKIDAATSVNAAFARSATTTPTPTPTPTPAATASPVATPVPAAVTTPEPAAPQRPADTRLVKTALSRAKHKVTFTFTNVGGPARFECSLAKKGKPAKFRPCRSPVTFKKLARGSYTFLVRAEGDTTPARKTFSV